MATELGTRIASAVVMLALVLTLTLWRVESFAVLCVVGGIIIWREWRALTHSRGVSWLFVGMVYIMAAIAALMYLRVTSLPILLSVFAIVWAGDTAAYFVGKKLGNHKILPSVSPGKSWEGLAAAMIVSAAVAASLGQVAPLPHALIGAALAVIGLGGDLFESYLKRKAGVKDSGHLIPGHGGLFDRVDALLPCAIFAATMLYIRMYIQ